MVELLQQGPLAGVRVVEFAGLGPGPHAAMMLSDMGAEVLRIERPGGTAAPNAVLDRGRHTVELNLRSDAGREQALEALMHADILIEGFRPGVMERLALGPDEVRERNPRLIYGRMTGWGQTGPKAMTAGHDINYIALTGALAGVTDGRGLPIPPLNLVGDFGGGSLYLVVGIVAALFERERSGYGQVIDAAMIDGAASLMAGFSGAVPSGELSLEPSRNLVGGAAPYYRCYRCRDGKFVAVGAIEPHFYDLLLDRAGGPMTLRERQGDWQAWPEAGNTLARIFAEKTQDEWCAILEDTDACVAPVLDLKDAPSHPHAQARHSYVRIDGVMHPAPAPRFSRTPGDIAQGGDGRELIERWVASNGIAAP